MEFVQAGTTHLISAKKLQRQTRKWMCCALIVGLIIVVAIVLFSVGFTKGFSG